MGAAEGDDLKALMIREIADDTRALERLQKELSVLEPRLLRAIAYFIARFGEADLPVNVIGADALLHTGPQPTRQRKRFGHADLCAIVVTEAGKLGEPVTVDAVRKLLIEAGFASRDYPTRDTLVSTLNRTPLFTNQGGGKFALAQAYRREDVPEKHRSKLAGRSAGNAETKPTQVGLQDSEALPASPSKTEDL